MSKHKSEDYKLTAVKYFLDDEHEQNINDVYSGSELKCRTYKSKTQVYPITSPVMNLKVYKYIICFLI